MLNRIDLSRTDLNLFVLFEAVMEELHVGRAAERLNLTASAVSHGLKRLRSLLDDPLFLKTPRGVTPTQRATELAPDIAELLARTRSIVGTTAPFEPSTTTRRFSIAAPDGVSAVFVMPLMRALANTAPRMGLSFRQLLPRGDTGTPELAWRDTFGALDAREMDIAVIPLPDAPARFHTQTIFAEEFVIAMRKGHPYAKRPGLERYCRMQHLVVSHTGDPHGAVDAILAQKGLSRTVAVTVPNFLFALATLAESDFIAALPARFVAMHGGRFGIISVPPPIKLITYQLTLVAPRVAMMDAGLAWMVKTIADVARQVPAR
jgi:DNA-binding transcriptional LysR family regulator